MKGLEKYHKPDQEPFDIEQLKIDLIKGLLKKDADKGNGYAKDTLDYIVELENKIKQLEQ